MDHQYVVTISHQLGCGGAAIGRRLSGILSIPFIDRQILQQVANHLHVPEEELESRDERKTSFWEAFALVEALNDPMSAAATRYIPSDRELYALESEYIEKLAKDHSAIILGRGGRYILRDHPRRFSVFLHAAMKDRILRITKQGNISETEAEKILEKDDRERFAYMKSFTRLDWLDVRSYDLCIDTSSIGLDNAAVLIQKGLAYKFGEH
jgi:cytidylate kinase